MNISELKYPLVINFNEICSQSKESVDRDNNPYERYVEGGHLNKEDIFIRSWGVFGDHYVGPAFHRIFTKGQVLYGSRRTYLKKVALAEFDGITSNTTFVINPLTTEKFYGPLLPYLMLSDKFTKYSILKSKGSTNPYINWKDLLDFECSIVEFSDQKIFYSILSEVDQIISDISNRLKDVERLIELFILSHLKDGGDIFVKDLINQVNDPISSVEQEVNYVGFEQISPNRLNLSEYEVVSNINSLKKKFVGGSILYGKIRPYLKKVCYVDDDMEGICSSDILVFKPKKENHLKIITAIFKSDWFVMKSMASAKGSKMPRADWRVLEKIKLSKELFTVESLSIFNEFINQKDILHERENLYKQLKMELINCLVE